MSDAPKKPGPAAQPQPPATPAAPPATPLATPLATPKPGAKKVDEIGGPPGPEPTRYGDWEIKGRVSDF